MANSKHWIMVLAIPTIFAVGIALFFVLLPLESISITNFVAYASGWSTVVMVLVYVFTTSRQLGIMQQQLKEMYYSRRVQVQPLIYPDKPKVTPESPHYYLGPETVFKKMRFMCRVFVDFKVNNLGNGPAVEIDFMPKLVSKIWDPTLIRPRGKVTELVDGLGQRMECISLREGDNKEIGFIFFDEELKFVNSLLDNFFAYVSCEIVFKNVLGMVFRETFDFRVALKDPAKEEEKLSMYLKTAKTAEIDFGKKIREFEALIEKGRENEAGDIFHGVNEEIKARFKGYEQLVLASDILPGSFSISTISQNDYEKMIVQRDARRRIILGSPKGT